jgi:hypothetical protein
LALALGGKQMTADDQDCVYGFHFGDDGGVEMTKHRVSAEDAAAYDAGGDTPSVIRDAIGDRPIIEVEPGANPKVVQRMLGHASAAMTLDVDADLFDTDLDTVAENVAKMWPPQAQVR